MTDPIPLGLGYSATVEPHRLNPQAMSISIRRDGRTVMWTVRDASAPSDLTTLRRMTARTIAEDAGVPATERGPWVDGFVRAMELAREGT